MTSTTSNVFTIANGQTRALASFHTNIITMNRKLVGTSKPAEIQSRRSAFGALKSFFESAPLKEGVHSIDDRDQNPKVEKDELRAAAAAVVAKVEEKKAPMPKPVAVLLPTPPAPVPATPVPVPDPEPVPAEPCAQLAEDEVATPSRAKSIWKALEKQASATSPIVVRVTAVAGKKPKANPAPVPQPAPEPQPECTIRPLPPILGREPPVPNAGLAKDDLFLEKLSEQREWLLKAQKRVEKARPAWY